MNISSSRATWRTVRASLWREARVEVGPSCSTSTWMSRLCQRYVPCRVQKQGQWRYLKNRKWYKKMICIANKLLSTFCWCIDYRCILIFFFAAFYNSIRGRHSSKTRLQNSFFENNFYLNLQYLKTQLRKIIIVVYLFSLFFILPKHHTYSGPNSKISPPYCEVRLRSRGSRFP